MVEAIPETATNAELYQRACTVLPGGVDSPVRAFKAVGGTPYFVSRAEGAHVWDVEGRRYVDYVQSYGASILGHAHPAVTQARSIQKQSAHSPASDSSTPAQGCPNMSHPNASESPCQSGKMEAYRGS